MPDAAEVRIGRLQRKLARALNQRDHWQKSCLALRAVLNEFPRIERQHKSLMDVRAERQRVKDLEARVKEQAALIELLRKSTPPAEKS